MSAILDGALELAQQKVRLFAVRVNSKLPAVGEFSRVATADPEKLLKLFGTTKYNSGIACGKYAEGLYLVGLDIDDKEGKRGYETLAVLEELGCGFPASWSQKTPSGGEHRLYWSPVPIRQGTNVAGEGIDFRGDGGYLVGPGSVLDGVAYTVLSNAPIARFPQWAVEKFERTATVHQLPGAGAGKLPENQILALKQSVEFLAAQPPAGTGSRSNECFRCAAQLRDFGLACEQAVEVMVEHWKAEPALDRGELTFTVRNAYHYGKNPVGSKAPENLFPVLVEDPLEKLPIDLMNESFFYVAFSGVTRVCWETTRDGKFHLERFPVFAFHEKFAARKMLHDGKQVPVTEVWIKSEKRRTYDYMRFDPGRELEGTAYNLWRGFHVKPGVASAHPGVQLFLEHCRENVCKGDEELFKWLITFIAHIFQKPGHKPEVSLVFKGKKGTGKTVISEILNHLIGDHSVILSDKTHATGHFNSMMEDKLLVTLEEAFWSGDKSVEGILKDIITGSTRVITHKGAEPYKAKVYDRIVIIGNESWLVPATSDERRFAVFNIGDGRRQDRKFFGTMKREIFEKGGDAALMRFFMDWSLGSADVNVAPETEGLNEQKNHSLGVFERWWFACLQEGQVLGSGLDAWPTEMTSNDLYSAFVLQMQNERYRGHLPTRIGVGMQFKHLSPTCGGTTVRFNSEGSKRVHVFSPLDLVREEWDNDRGFKTKWEE